MALPPRRAASTGPDQPGKAADADDAFADPLRSVRSELGALSGNIEELLKTAGDSPVLEAAASYFFQQGKNGQQGKHFRPSVVLLMAQATAAHRSLPPTANESQQRLAEISEMIHTASLLHDDVIDESDERRGKASGKAAFGNKVAVLAGDFLLARASMALARLRDCEVVEVVSLVIEELVEGELLQIRVGSGSALGRQQGLSHAELFQLYLRKNYLKTGSLIANSCRASAMLGAHDAEVCDAAYEYGRHLGLAFQLIDDALDFRASSAVRTPLLLRRHRLVPFSEGAVYCGGSGAGQAGAGGCAAGAGDGARAAGLGAVPAAGGAGRAALRGAVRPPSPLPQPFRPEPRV